MQNCTLSTAPTTAADRQTTTSTARIDRKPTKGFKILEARRVAVANGDGTQKSQHAQWLR